MNESSGSKGIFIVFEGIDGSGKSTQSKLLSTHLDALHTHAPGATSLGVQIRKLILESDHEISPLSEALLLLADRSQHVSEVIKPALDQGEIVVCDRFSGSTLAYQGYGRGIEIDVLEKIVRWAAFDLEPDLVILLDLPSEVAQTRRKIREGNEDRMESQDIDFLNRVRNGYLEMARNNEKKWIVLDGTIPVMELNNNVISAVLERVGILSSRNS